MKRTNEASRAEELLDRLDPATTAAKYTTPLARIAQLTDRRGELDRDLRDAVRLARTLGFSWTDVAISLNVSRQAARQKYGPLEDR